MKTRLVLFISLAALALIGVTAALAGGVDLSLSSKTPAESRALAAGLDIESSVASAANKELDSYSKELPPLSINGDSFVNTESSAQPGLEIAGSDRFGSKILSQPLSIYGDSFVYPGTSSQPDAEIAGLNPDLSIIQNQAQVSVGTCQGVLPEEFERCRNALQAPRVASARFDQAQGEIKPAATLVEVVRQSTTRYKSVEEGEAAGYGLFLGCVSGPQEGAMGVHFVNGELVGDGVLDPMHPEALLYEFKNGQMQLAGVEYIVIAEAWDANNETPPVVMGQLLHFAGSPNRYGIPAFYELHVWAWKTNPLGTFADWNPEVSCGSYAAEDATIAASH